MKIEISEEFKFAIKDIYEYLSKISTKYASKTVNNIYKIVRNK